MRIVIGLFFALAVTVSAAQSGKGKKNVTHSEQGIKTPGVQIPVASLKAEAELPLAPQWLVFSDTILIPNKSGGLERLDAKTNKLVDPVPGVTNLCGGAAIGFASLWIPDCADHSLTRLDAKIAADPKAPMKPGRGRGARAAEGEAKPAEAKTEAEANPAKIADPVKIDTGVGGALPAVAANP